ncbi:unnamed protein product [Sphagnum balticum]
MSTRSDFGKKKKRKKNKQQQAAAVDGNVDTVGARAKKLVKESNIPTTHKPQTPKKRNELRKLFYFFARDESAHNSLSSVPVFTSE